MTKQFEVKALTENELPNFLMKFYEVDSMDKITEVQKNGMVALKHFKYVNRYTFGYDYNLINKSDKDLFKGHHVLIFIDRKTHVIASVIDYWDRNTYSANSEAQGMSFVDFRDTYSDEQIKKMLPEIFSELAHRITTKKFSDVYQNPHDKKIGMQEILRKAIENQGIIFLDENF